MKLDTLAIAAAAGLGLFLIYRVSKGQSLTGTKAAPTATGANRQAAVEITNTSLPGQNGWGWKYFTDGTAIGPDGRYYSGGQEVYNPAGVLGVLQ